MTTDKDFIMKESSSSEDQNTSEENLIPEMNFSLFVLSIHKMHMIPSWEPHILPIAYPCFLFIGKCFYRYEGEFII